LAHRSNSAAGVGPRHALYVDSPIYARRAYGVQHPLAIARTETVTRLAEVLGWLPRSARVTSTAASTETLARFHDPAYIAALKTADDSGTVTRAQRQLYNFGTMENPLFPGVFERAATTVGGSILAAELALEGRITFHPAGGTHHGQRARASGFCYFNDPVFALLTLLDAGLERVVYVDLDAHHGDGVEAAFESDPRVHLASVHETGRWPHSGTDNGNGRMCNVPVAQGCDDQTFEAAIDERVLPFVVRARPEALVITCGADALAGDPLSSMKLTNTSLWRTVDRISALADAVVVLGGGGYNPWTLARCWAGLWARLAGFEIPAAMPPAACAILGALHCDLVDDEDIDETWLTDMIDGARRGQTGTTGEAEYE